MKIIFVKLKKVYVKRFRFHEYQFKTNGGDINNDTFSGIIVQELSNKKEC